MDWQWLTEKVIIAIHVLDHEAGHRFLLLLLHPLQEFGIDRDGPIGLGFARIDPDGTSSEVDVIPSQGQELGLPRTSSQIEADLYGPFEVGFGVLHGLPLVIYPIYSEPSNI